MVPLPLFGDIIGLGIYLVAFSSAATMMAYIWYIDGIEILPLFLCGDNFDGLCLGCDNVHGRGGIYGRVFTCGSDSDKYLVY